MEIRLVFMKPETFEADFEYLFFKVPTGNLRVVSPDNKLLVDYIVGETAENDPMNYGIIVSENGNVVTVMSGSEEDFQQVKNFYPNKTVIR